jgi:hypothetical protein
MQGLATFDRGGSEQGRDDLHPQADYFARAAACSRTAQLIAKQLAHVLAESFAERRREQSQQRGEHALGDREPVTSIAHVAHLSTRALTDGDVTNA